MDPLNKKAKILWDYLRLHQPLAPAHAICALGSDSTRVAQYAADLWQQGYAPYLIVSGGQAHRSKDGQTEAEIYATIARDQGVPEDRILIENRATNTGENIMFIKEILQEKRFDFDSFILVHKPYMERRVWATFKKMWPKASCIVTSPQIDFEVYTKTTTARDEIITHLMSTLHRIQTYPQLNFQIPQDIPPTVEEAYNDLLLLGYNPR